MRLDVVFGEFSGVLRESIHSVFRNPTTLRIAILCINNSAGFSHIGDGGKRTEHTFSLEGGIHLGVCLKRKVVTFFCIALQQFLNIVGSIVL